MGFEPDDWRFLAAQFYDGLLLSEPRNLSIQRWGEGYGARFNVLMLVTSRRGTSGIMRTGWMLRPGMLPRLVTAYPDHCEQEVVQPPVPPVVVPNLSDEEWCSDLFALADSHGCDAHRNALPTPMLLEDYGIVEEGQCGRAYVLIPDDPRGFARWLELSGRGRRRSGKTVVISCRIPAQSAERSEAYAGAFARVLALNGITSQTEVIYT